MNISSNNFNTGYCRSPADQRCRLRIAGLQDIKALETVERDAFSSQWPTFQFKRELTRPRSCYIVAVSTTHGSDLKQNKYNGLNSETASGVHANSGSLKRIFKTVTENWLVKSAVENRYQPLEQTAGYVGTWFISGEAHIVSIAVAETYRGRGIGELLLIGALAEARRQEADEMTLEVRRSNIGAIALYEKYGFNEVGIRKRYYVNDGEDAVIMTTPPIASTGYSEMVDILARNHSERWGHSAHAPA